MAARPRAGQKRKGAGRRRGPSPGARRSGLVSKLSVPRLDRAARRPRVLAAIERGLRSGICWLAAPAGYGKTTAIVDYLRARPTRHVWYRVDAGDQDVASFFHYLALSLGPRGAGRSLPTFGREYMDQPLAFGRRFFRSYFALLPEGTLLVIDDLHDADAAPFHALLAVLLAELPDGVRCACLSRSLPPDEVAGLALRGRLAVLDRSILEFSPREAHGLITRRVGRAGRRVDVSAARGWAAGLVLLAERAATDGPRPGEPSGGGDGAARGAGFAALAGALFESLAPAERDALLKLSVLPEITPDLACALTGSESAPTLLRRLHQRQLLVSRDGAGQPSFQIHDLLREFLQDALAQRLDARALAQLHRRAAELLARAGRPDAAVELAIRAAAWPLARRLLAARAEDLLAQGRRATLIEWCLALPPDQRDDAWLCYWLGVAHMSDDAVAEGWFARAWSLFTRKGDVVGRCLTAAQAIFAKTDSWRTHEGLSTWTTRLVDLLQRDVRLPEESQLLVWSGMLRAVDFADDYRSGAPVVRRLTARLAARLAAAAPGDVSALRLVASEALIEHAGSTGQAELFEKAVDSVTADLRAGRATPWTLGLWLVAFGSVSGRYFPYARRGFPYASAEEALRAAVDIGEREGLRGVEFGALYHLQLLLKLVNEREEFGRLVERLAHIADSRHTTQVAVVADCQAALHTLQGRIPEAWAATERFMAAIEAAREPPIERWPHFVTKFQVLLADRRAREAATYLEGLLHLFDGEVRRRTSACILVAEALDARWRDAPDAVDRLRACLREVRLSHWPAVLGNLPGLLAELCADGLRLGIEPDLCRTLIKRRRLVAPGRGAAAWPWALRVSVLGPFRLEREGMPLVLGPKAPTRALDVIRLLAISPAQSRSLEEVQDALWPDLDGDQARAACEQAVHRLRRLLDIPDAVVQRQGVLSLSSAVVWVDLPAWEAQVRRALGASPAGEPEMERAWAAFPGPLFQSAGMADWALGVAERVERRYMELARRLAALHAARGDGARARAVNLCALDHYPRALSLVSHP